MRSLAVLSCLTALSLASGCATKPAAPSSSLKTAFVEPQPVTKPLKADDPVTMNPEAWELRNGDVEKTSHASIFSLHHLAGRTLAVSSLHDLKLADKEVVLTFDDGPVPGKTEAVLATLDKFGVKAAFMMVGEMAQAHPEIAKKVAADGDTIGSHTFRHPDLAKMNFNEAVAEVAHGRAAVSKAVGEEVHFFHFPYLAESKRLRAAIAAQNMIVLDADVDSKDYFSVKPDAVVERTMAELHHRGRGIILMHDIHTRTAQMLPTLLERLEKEGYKIVTLKFKGDDASPLVAMKPAPALDSDHL